MAQHNLSPHVQRLLLGQGRWGGDVWCVLSEKNHLQTLELKIFLFFTNEHHPVQLKLHAAFNLFPSVSQHKEVNGKIILMM